ncbi:MAG: hypothetical protein HYX59_01495 [Elusimicrobia bacterium]|nr:hypothetical protein [Elusimicrobiota bacterium]
MMKIISTSEDKQASVDLDPHIPFTLRLGIPPAGGSFIWHCSDDGPDENSSRLEVWVHARTGAIHKVTLVWISPARVKVTEDFDNGPTIPTTGRVPVCDTAPWMQGKAWNNPEEPAKKGIDESHRFDLIVGENFASVMFADMGEPKSWFVNQRSRFGVNAEGFLCRIDLINLRPEDLEQLREALEPSEPKP